MSTTSSRGRGARPEREPAIVLIGTVGNVQSVTRCDPRAAAAGVREGMGLAHATALLPSHGVHVEPFDPQREAQSLHALASWATRFSPSVMPDPPDGLLLDITGCERLFRGERRLLRLVVSSVRRLGLDVRVASAPTFGCAWALARYGECERDELSRAGPSRARRRDADEPLTVRDLSDVRAALAPLPIAALRVDEDTAGALAEVGIDRVAHLLDLPRSALAERYGQALLLRLDQAMGQASEVIEPIRPTTPLRVERVFDGPTCDLEGLILATRGLIESLCTALLQREQGARRVELVLDRADADAVVLTIDMSRPSREARHLWALLRPKLERANLGEGVEALELHAPRVGRLRHEQGAAWKEMAQSAGEGGGGEGDARDDGPLIGEMLDVLVNRLGADRVSRLERVETHIPEWVSARRPVESAARRVVATTSSSAADGAAVAPERPTLLLPRPEMAEVVVLSPEGPVSLVRWRGEACRVVASVGPERIGPAWWRTDGDPQGPTVLARDYYRVQYEAGRWLWLFRLSPPPSQQTQEAQPSKKSRWFVHGLWV